MGCVWDGFGTGTCDVPSALGQRLRLWDDSQLCWDVLVGLCPKALLSLGHSPSPNGSPSGTCMGLEWDICLGLPSCPILGTPKRHWDIWDIRHLAIGMLPMK
jgi:hypothetical protein